jgi:transaldolase
MNPLQQLGACGLPPWVDHLSRAFVVGGSLKALVENDGVRGVTSNPSIFEKAIAETDEYAEAISEFRAIADHSVNAIYEHLAIADIQSAADALRAVCDRTNRGDGYVSLECSPRLEHNAAAGVTEALRLWAAGARPNLMVKVPATPEGIVPIPRLAGRRLNVNVTLLFSIEVYEEVVEAYMAGLEQFRDADGDLCRVGGVASFFVSRIDLGVSARLDALGQKRSMTMGAVSPLNRRAPMNVVVFQCPCGIAARSRSPLGARPRIRAMLVVTQVSSMKTSPSGSRSSCPSNPSSRRSATSGRACSLACAVFFKGQPATREAFPQGRARNRHAAFHREPFEQFADRQVRRLVDQGFAITGPQVQTRFVSRLRTRARLLRSWRCWESRWARSLHSC